MNNKKKKKKELLDLLLESKLPLYPIVSCGSNCGQNEYVTLEVIYSLITGTCLHNDE